MTVSTLMKIYSLLQLLQVFESHGDFLNNELFKEYSLKYLKQINRRVKEKLKNLNIPEVPMVKDIKYFKP